MTRPTPYYDRDGITIYHGDCREILPALGLDPAEVVVITDPPYGIGYVHGAENGPHRTEFAGVPVIGDDEPFDPSHLLEYPDVLMWGAHHYADRLPVREGRWFLWDKRCGIIPPNDLGDGEMAWARGTDGTCLRIFRHFWDGFNKQSERGIKRVHPTQKPIALMRWCIDQYRITEDANPRLIVDPYMGSGSTLRAAADLHLPAIGIELDETYIKAAIARLRQLTLPLGDGMHAAASQ